MDHDETLFCKPPTEPRYGPVTIEPGASRVAALPCRYAGVPDGDVRPAPSTLQHGRSTSGDPSLDFMREGFCILPSVLGPDDVAELRQEYVRLATNWRTTKNLRDGYDLEPRQPGFEIRRTEDCQISPEDFDRVSRLPIPAFRKIGGIYELSEACKRLAHNPMVVGLMRKLMGPDVFLFRDLIYPHIARVSREKPWHNDADYWRREWNFADKIVQTMTVIDPHRISNGCLQVIPRSHEKAWDHHFDGDRKVSLGSADLSRATFLELEPGDVLVFDSRLLHASMSNKSDRDRCVVYNAYCPPVVTFKGQGAGSVLIPITSPREATANDR